MNGMIYHKIFIAEQRLRNVLLEHSEKLETINRIKDFLNRVDDSAEFIVASTLCDLERVVSELKGSHLDESEKAMVREIFLADKTNDQIEKIDA